MMGDSEHNIKNGDTLQTSEKVGIVTEITQRLNPALNNVNKTLNSLDVLIQQLNATLASKTQGNLQSVIASLAATSRQLEQLLAAQSAVVGKTIHNVERITDAFARNSGKIDTTLNNLEKTTANLSQADIQGTVESVTATMHELQNTLNAINNQEGSLGLLLKDPKLYNEIRMTNRSLTTLLDDIRVNPRRYVNVSVFGKKARPGPILQHIIYD